MAEQADVSKDTKQAQQTQETWSTSDYATAKAGAVIRASEIGRFVDLGLGRGVDITKQTPWLCKSSFQVRPVLLENIIGTEEGGSLQNYEREIVSIQEQRGEMKASITVPQSPVTIGVDAEQSRSHSSKRRSVGKKVINRTISFRADFQDAPSSSTRDPRQAKVEASLSRKSNSLHSGFSTSPQEDFITVENEKMTFEERLCRWILERVEYRSELKSLQTLVEKGVSPKEEAPDHLTFAIDKQLLQSKRDPGLSNPIEVLGKFIQDCTHEERKQIVNDCKDFVYHFRITHYVSAIKLGAAEYRVLSEDEYETRIGTGGSFGFEALANAAVKESVRWNTIKRASDLKRIGLIKPDGTVERGSYGEAVVGIQIQPISSLVKIRYLQLALQQELAEYSSHEGDKSSGPFIISCNNDEVYLTVNKQDYTIEGTINIAKASSFHIALSDGSHPSEFMIIYYGEKNLGRHRQLRRGSSSLTSQFNQAIRPMPRYLNAEVNTMGRNPGPLQLSMHVNESSARLVLHSRVQTRRRRTVVDSNPWVSGREVYSICCARRRLKREGYLCVEFKPGRENMPAYSTCIVPSVKGHSEESKFTLFRLLPACIKQQLVPTASAENGDNEEHEEQQKGREELEELGKQYRRYSEWRAASRRHVAFKHQ